MWYLKENNTIVDISEVEKENYIFTDENIVEAFDGSLVLESQTKTPKYITEETEFYRLNNVRCRIDELKQNLADTDYQAIKYAEGLISEQEYLPIKNQRQEWRDEINQLENQL